jgi:hypothetical protein
MLLLEAIRLVHRQEQDHGHLDSDRLAVAPTHARGHAHAQVRAQDARARPGGLTYGSWFNGSPGHLGGLQLQAMKSLQMVHVPFRDFGQLYAAVASQQVDWALGSIASAGALERRQDPFHRLRSARARPAISERPRDWRDA